MLWLKWTLLSAALTAMLLSSGCAGVSMGTECAWSRDILPEPGWEERWTTEELRQVVRHNELRARLCAN